MRGPKKSDNFKITELGISGVMLIETKEYIDYRGSFMVTCHSLDKAFVFLRRMYGPFVQENQSVSKRGVLRGLHSQLGNYAQGKLIRVVSGSVIDVIVDVRPGSPTEGKHLSLKISADKSSRRMVFVPPGCLHGFLALEDNTVFLYKTTKKYYPKRELGVKWDDPELAIDWRLKENAFTERDLIISDKDFALGSYQEYKERCGIVIPPDCPRPLGVNGNIGELGEIKTIKTTAIVHPDFQINNPNDSDNNLNNNLDNNSDNQEDEINEEEIEKELSKINKGTGEF